MCSNSNNKIGKININVNVIQAFIIIAELDYISI